MTRYLLICTMMFAVTGDAQKAPEASEQDGRPPPTIDKVFFAQQHVQEPSDPLFKMVGNLPALIKVQVYSDKPRKAPGVVAILRLGKMKRDPLPHQEKKPSYVTTAINLPARDGEITEMDLLHTPNVVSKGVPANATVLYHWKAKK